VLRKRFLKPDIVGLIPTGGYSGNVNYSKKASMWLVYGEMKDGVANMHFRNGREYSLPELTLLWMVSARRRGPCTNYPVVATTVYVPTLP